MDLYTNDLVRKSLERAQRFLAEEATAKMDVYATFAFSDNLPFKENSPRCGSPIEAVFELWWQAVTIARNLDWNPFILQAALERQANVECDGQKYRLDFRVVPERDDLHIGWRAQEGKSVPLPKIAVELDGHDFHERTKEQVIQRNQRDRDLQRHGWRVFHFSGSELVRRPQQCIEEVYREVDSSFHDFVNALLRTDDAG